MKWFETLPKTPFKYLMTKKEIKVKDKELLEKLSKSTDIPNWPQDCSQLSDNF